MAGTTGGDHYSALGVPREASRDEIKRAYRAAVKKYHPDADGNSYFFRQIQEAYETLSDPVRRAAYDRERERPRPEHPRPGKEPPRQQRESSRSAGSGDTGKSSGRGQSDGSTRRSASSPPPEPDPGPAVPSFSADSVTWWSRVDPAAPIRCRAVFAPSELAFLMLAGVWSALVLTGVVASLLSGDNPGSVSLLLLMVAPTVWCAVGALRGRPPTRRIVLWSLGLGIIQLLIGLLGLAQDQATGGAVFLVFGIGAMALPWLAIRYAAHRSKRFDWTANLWSWPNDGVPRAGDQERAAALTAELLAQYLTRIPAVRIVRNPPGLGTAIDHLVLCGTRVVLISSVIWPAGRYTLGASGDVLRDGRPVSPGTTGLGHASQMCRRRLRQAEIRGIVLMWPQRSDQRTVSRTNWSADTPWALAGPETLVRDVGAWLAEQPTTVHRRMLRALVLP